MLYTEHELMEQLHPLFQKRKETKQLVSYSETIVVSLQNPLSFWHNGKKLFNEQRTYWVDADRQHMAISLGVAHEWATEVAEQRFVACEQQWNEMVKLGTGIRAIGGFSFDPLKLPTDLWQSFPAAKFIVPQLLFVERNGVQTLTTTIVCDAAESDRDVFVRWKQLVALARQLMTMPFVMNEQQPLMEEKRDIAPEQWKRSVEGMAQQIADGQFEKVVLAREARLSFAAELSLTAAIHRLTNDQLGCYIYAFQFGGDCFVGASPERLVQKQGERVATMGLAGSIRRGRDEAEDRELGHTLLTDEKNLGEHDVVVNMICQALATHGASVKREALQLYKTKYIQHLYTPITAQHSQLTLMQLVELLHPTPALGGFPREVALEKIRQEEVLDRGWYAAPIGWMDEQHNGEFVVAIRSALVQHDEASLFAGCGIVANSDAESEFDEAMVKMKPMLHALGGELWGI